MEPRARASAALLRYDEQELDLLSTSEIKAELKESAAQFRAFAFLADRELIPRTDSRGLADEELDPFTPLRNQMIDEASVAEPSVRRRFYSQGRISSRLLSGLYILHCAIDAAGIPALLDRRFVLVKERPGSPTIFHISSTTSLLAYVDAAPPEHEQPTIYLG